MLRKEETRYRHSVYLVRLSNRGVHSLSEEKSSSTPRIFTLPAFAPFPPTYTLIQRYKLQQGALSLLKVQLENAICNRKKIDNSCGGNGIHGKDTCY